MAAAAIKGLNEKLSMELKAKDDDTQDLRQQKKLSAQRLNMLSNEVKSLEVKN